MKADIKTETEVMAVIKQFVESFTKKDLESNLALYAPDADVVLIGTGVDEKRVGLIEIEAEERRAFAQSDEHSIHLDWYSVSAAGSVAWLASNGSIQARIGGQEISFPVRLTFVLENREGRWLIMQVHGSLPAVGQKEGDSWPTD